MYNVIILFMYLIIVASQLLQMHCGVTILCFINPSWENRSELERNVAKVADCMIGGPSYVSRR